MGPLGPFLSGAIMLGAAAVGLFFLKYWLTTRDRLFLLFGLAFFFLSLERWMMVLVHPSHEMRPYVFGVRLLAFVLIGAAIVDRNRRS